MHALRFALVALLVAAPLRGQTTIVVPGDAASIQAAVDMSANGDTILIKAGTWAEAVVVNDRSNLTIKGKGKVILDPVGGAGIALALTNCTAPVVTNLRMTGATTGLHVEACDGGNFSKCRIEGMGGSAVIVTGSTSVTVQSFVIEGVGGNGIALGQGDPFFADECQVLKNKVTGAGQAGIFVSGANNVISKNRLLDCGQRGCLLEDVPEPVGNVFSFNKVIDAGVAGFRAHGTDNLIEKCTVIGGGNGFEMVDGAGLVLRKCKVVKCEFDGILGADNVFPLTIEDCRVTKPLENGVIVTGPDVVVTGCRVSGAGTNGFAVLGDNGAWTGNRASGSFSDGFEVSGTGNTLTFNKAKGSEEGFDLNDLAGEGMNLIDETNSFGTEGP